MCLWGVKDKLCVYWEQLSAPITNWIYKLIHGLLKSNENQRKTSQWQLSCGRQEDKVKGLKSVKLSPVQTEL